MNTKVNAGNETDRLPPVVDRTSRKGHWEDEIVHMLTLMLLAWQVGPLRKSFFFVKIWIESEKYAHQANRNIHEKRKNNQKQ